MHCSVAGSLHAGEADSAADSPAGGRIVIEPGSVGQAWAQRPQPMQTSSSITGWSLESRRRARSGHGQACQQVRHTMRLKAQQVAGSIRAVPMRISSRSPTGCSAAVGQTAMQRSSSCPRQSVQGSRRRSGAMGAEAARPSVNAARLSVSDGQAWTHWPHRMQAARNASPGRAPGGRIRSSPAASGRCHREAKPAPAPRPAPAQTFSHSLRDGGTAGIEPPLRPFAGRALQSSRTTTSSSVCPGIRTWQLRHWAVTSRAGSPRCCTTGASAMPSSWQVRQSRVYQAS